MGIFQDIPNDVLADEKRKIDADNWAAVQRRQLADEWAAEQRRQMMSWFEQAGQGAVGALGQANETVRRIPGVAGVADVAGAVLEPVGRAFDWETENISRPGLEFVTRTMNAGEPFSPLARGLIGAGGNPVTFYESLKKGWEERPEPLPGVKGALEMVAAPSNLIGAGEIGKGIQLAGKGAKALAESERVRAGVRAVDRAITNPELARMVPGATVEDVGGRLSKAIYDMTPEELEAAYQRVNSAEKNIEVSLFGDEGAKQYKRAQSISNSSSRSASDIEEAERIIDRMEASLSEQQRNRLFGIDEAGITADEYRQMLNAVRGLDYESPQALGDSLKWAVTKIGKQTDPGLMTSSEQQAYAQLRHGIEQARAMGWNVGDVAKAALQGSADRFADPQDAELMLSSWLDRLKASARADVPRSASSGATPPMPPAAPPTPPGVSGAVPPSGGLPEERFGSLAKAAIARGESRPLPPPESAYGQVQRALTPTEVDTRDAISNATDKFLRDMYDRNWNANEIERASGVPVHKLAQSVPGSTAYGQFLVEKQVDPLIRQVGRDTKLLEEYMVSRRMEDLLAKNPSRRLPEKIPGWSGVLRSQDEMRSAWGPEKYARIEQAAKELEDANKKLVLDARVEAGILSPEQRRDILADNRHYISFYREDYAGLQTGAKIGRGEANVSNTGLELLDLEGSWRRLDNPLARFRASVISTQRLIAENKAARSIVDGLVEMEKAGAAKGGASAPLESGERFVKILKPGQAAEHSNIWDTVSFYQRGEKITAQVPAVYAQMAKGLEAESADTLNRFLRATTGILRGGAVTFNVAFTPKNIIRDMISAYYREGLHPLSKDYVSGWLASITHNSDYADAARAGVLMSGIVDSMRSADAMSRAMSGSIRVASFKDALLLIPRIIEKVGVTSEQATRIATFKKLTGQGVDDLSAAVRARDVTVDFSKAGNVMKVVNQILPFSNAGVQGAANTLRTMRYNPKQALIGAAPLGMASMMAFLWNQRFETAKMIPDNVYENDWAFIVGEGQKNPDPKYPNKPGEKFPIYVRVPKGQTAALLTAPVELALRFAWANNDRSVLDQFFSSAQTMARSLSPVEPNFSGITPPLAGTAIGVSTNTDTFRGQNIVPRGEQDRLPELQFGPETSKTAVLLGEKFKVSPRMIEWAIKDASGGVGGQMNWMADLALGALGYDTSSYGEAKAKTLTASERLAKTPVASSFLGTRNSQQSNLGWENLDKATENSQRLAAANPELRRLGITIGQQQEKLTVDKESVVLTPAERADLQDGIAKFALHEVAKVQKVANYDRLSDRGKAELLQKAIDAGRDNAKEYFWKRIPNRDSRIQEAMPTPLTAVR